MSQQVLPKQFGRYVIEGELGRGGMGSVYLAHDSELQRQVALKVPHFDANTHPQVIARFRREAVVAARIHHPNICPIFDVGEVEGTHFLTMPFLKGTPLSRHIDPEQPWSAVQAAQLMCKLARALAEMHDHGVIHRDLKPGNILIQSSAGSSALAGEPIIMDFGLARSLEESGHRMTESGQPMGTPVYMALPLLSLRTHVAGTGPPQRRQRLGPDVGRNNGFAINAYGETSIVKPTGWFTKWNARMMAAVGRTLRQDCGELPVVIVWFPLIHQGAWPALPPGLPGLQHSVTVSRISVMLQSGRGAE